jgi:hypothetical protein
VLLLPHLKENLHGVFIDFVNKAIGVLLTLIPISSKNFRYKMLEGSFG